MDGFAEFSKFRTANFYQCFISLISVISVEV